MKTPAAREGGERKKLDEAWVETGLVFTLENGEGLGPEDVSTVSITLDTYSHAVPALQEGAAMLAGVLWNGLP